MKNQSYLIVELTKNYIKCLEVREFSGYKETVAFDCYVLEDENDEQVVRILSDISRKKPSLRKKVRLVFPRHQVILKHLKMPSHDKWEIEKMLPLQLANMIPYAIEDVYFDYDLLEKDTEGFSRVLVAIANRESLQRYFRVFKMAGFEIAHVLLTSSGLQGWFNRFVLESQQQLSGPVVLLNIDESYSEICFCAQDKFFSSRSIHYGAETILERFSDFIKEVQLSVDAYSQKRQGPELKGFLVVGRSEMTSQVSARLKDHFALPFLECDELDLDSSGGSLYSKEFSRKNISVTACLGLKDLTQGIDLIPEEIHLSRIRTKMISLAVSFCFLLLLSGCLLVSFFVQDIYFKQSELNQLQSLSSSVEPMIDRGREYTDRFQALSRFRQNEVNVLECIDGLFVLTPEEVSYRSFYLDEERRIVIQGYSKSSLAVNTLQESLVRSDLFENVNLEFATKRRMYSQEVIDFKIVMKLGQT